MTPLIALLLLVLVVIRVMTPDQRALALRDARAYLAAFKAAATRPRPDYEPFRTALRSRTPRLFATPALVALNVAVFVCMLFSAGSIGSADMLIAWGGNFGPGTTNGEWWRLVTALFVHRGLLQLLVNTAALLQVGLVLERFAGPFAFAAAYVASGVLAGLVGLSDRPVEVSAGASNAVLCLYGLLTVIVIGGRLRPSSITMPAVGIRRLLPAAAVFLIYSIAPGGFDRAEMAGLLTGLAYGLVIVPGIGDRLPPIRRGAAATVATLMIALILAASHTRIVDARPDIAYVIAVEQRTAIAYDAAVERFRKGKASVEALVKMIDQTIVPELHAADARLKALGHVPAQQQPLVADAERYLQLRRESWRLRAEGLRKTSMVSLKQADRTERASLDAFKKIKSVRQN
jgi:rhomboid protease GluP